MQRVSGGSVVDVGRMNGVCGEVIWRVWGDIQDSLWRLSGGCE